MKSTTKTTTTTTATNDDDDHHHQKKNKPVWCLILFFFPCFFRNHIYSLRNVVIIEYIFFDHMNSKLQINKTVTNIYDDDELKNFKILIHNEFIYEKQIFIMMMMINIENDQ